MSSAMYKFSHNSVMEDIVRRHQTFSGGCASVILIMIVVSCFLLLFSYTESLVKVNDALRQQSVFFSDNIYDNSQFTVQRYSWQCQEKQCVKTLADDEEIPLNTCNMLCSEPAVWPKPLKLQMTNKAASVIDKSGISFDFVAEGLVKTMLQNTTESFTKSLNSSKTGNKSEPRSELSVKITVLDSNIDQIRLNTNESYQLLVRKGISVNVTISAATFFGARHALETLSQLIWYDEVIDELRIVHDVTIWDYPKFPYRGLMVDTARNFFPISKLKKVIDGMAMSKLNALHLHATDAVSFPLVLPRNKQLASFGAYGHDMTYTPDDVRDLKEYALTRGIRVIIEVDAPGHVNAGWNFAGNAVEKNVICGENDVFNGHLNPDNENVLNILEEIYADLLELVGDNEIFHIGSDEVNLDCWKHTEAVKKTNNQNSLKTFWAVYTNQMLELLRRANNNSFPEHVVMWSSPLTESPRLFESLNKKITVQHWLGDPKSVLNGGHSIIYSTVGHWYLDCGFGPWKPGMTRGVCDPYTPWQTFYNHRPWSQNGHEELVLGGEVCLWTEQVDVDTLETRIWPRSAAFAERVWSDPGSTNDDDVYTRLVMFIDRLKSRSIQVAGIWPRWCSQNPGKC